MAKGPWTKNNYFAVYRGDELLAHGPVVEMAWLFNMREKSLRELSHISHHKRAAQAKNPDEWLIAVKVDELTDEDLEIRYRNRRRV